MQYRVTQIIYVCTAILLWISLAYLVVIDDAGQRALLDARAILCVVLLIAAPAATFIPLARWVGAPLYDVEGIVGWVGLGFMLAFVIPAHPIGLGQFIAFLVTLTIALASGASMLAYLIGLRVLRDSPRRFEFLRARRQGYLVSFATVSMIVLSSVGTLTAMSAAMMLVIVVLVEMLALAHTSRNLLRLGIGPRAASSPRTR